MNLSRSLLHVRRQMVVRIFSFEQLAIFEDPPTIVHIHNLFEGSIKADELKVWPQIQIFNH